MTPPTHVPASSSQRETITYVTIEQFADIMQITPRTVKAWLKKGLPSVKVGNVRRIVREQADAWMASGGGARPRVPRARRSITGTGQG